jgi:hypothetical protein
MALSAPAHSPTNLQLRSVLPENATALRHRLSSWTSDEIKVLIRQGPPFWEDQSERRCPACGHVSVRSYMYYSYQPRVISKTWCGHCWRFASSTGPEPPVPFTDPLAGVERGKIGLDFLNERWDKGVLPQRFG